MLVTVIRWPLYWMSTPPTLSAIEAVDRVLATETPAAVVDDLPGVREAALPVLYLSGASSSLYLHWSPLSPPVYWLMPPSARSNSPAEYAWVASFADAYQVRYIVVPEDFVSSFVEDPSPISDLLRERYRPGATTPWGRVFERRAGV